MVARRGIQIEVAESELAEHMPTTLPTDLPDGWHIHIDQERWRRKKRSQISGSSSFPRCLEVRRPLSVVDPSLRRKLSRHFVGAQAKFLRNRRRSTKSAAAGQRFRNTSAIS
jgi:hypothetical protein